MPQPSLPDVLAHAVADVGGTERPGQVPMAEAVAGAMTDGQHLMVQAGTGTGKSLAYLVPALLHEGRVVVATATLALQRQLVERDLPRLVEAVTSMEGGSDVDTTFAIQKGRANYPCLHRMHEGVPDEQGTLVDVPMGPLATKVLELRKWADQETRTGAPASATTPRGTRTGSGAR